MSTIAELKAAIKSGEITELPKLYSGRVFQIRFCNRRFETLAPGASEWRHCSKDTLVCDFGIGRVAMPKIDNILEMLDY